MYQDKTYRNLFAECGHGGAAILEKLDGAWRDLFYGTEDTRIYYPVGNDTGYILDTGNLDARTEGMSYGMMMCVQMDKKDEFDRLWKWAHTYMRLTEGKYAGYFAWSVSSDGAKLSDGPAPDGEEYFAMALLFASHRWGDGPPPFDYGNQARVLLRECVHKGGAEHPEWAMWNGENKLIKFVPSSTFTDPSYHLPHFCRLFAEFGDPRDREFWLQAEQNSREYIVKACHPETGLAAEYAEYDGTPRHNEGHGRFFSDAYRVAGNIGLDYEWFGPFPAERMIANNIQRFFGQTDGGETVWRQYEADGTPAVECDYFHANGLLAMNAMASLAADGPLAKRYAEKLWNLPLRTGVRRYYDNCLHFFALLALGGRYRIW